MTSIEVTKVDESITMDKQTLHVVCDVLSQCDQPFFTQLFSVCLLTALKLSVLSVSDYSINLSIFIQSLHERSFSFFEFYSLLVRPFVPILTHAKLFLGVWFASINREDVALYNTTEDVGCENVYF
jgi:hypothetical protein